MEEKLAMIPSAPAWAKTSAAQTYLCTSSLIIFWVIAVGFPYVLLKQGSSLTADADLGYLLRNSGTWRPGNCN